jgi:hypothetical protein
VRAVSFHKPVKLSVAPGNKLRLTTSPSHPPNTILNPKAQTDVFVSELLLDPAKELGSRLSGRKLGRRWTQVYCGAMDSIQSI